MSGSEVCNLVKTGLLLNHDSNKWLINAILCILIPNRWISVIGCLVNTGVIVVGNHGYHLMPLKSIRNAVIVKMTLRKLWSDHWNTL